MKSPTAFLALGEGTRLQVFFPVQPVAAAIGAGKEERPPNRQEEASQSWPDDSLLKERLFELRKRGFNRLYQHGQIVEFSTPESLLDLNFAEPVFVLIDRISVSPDVRARIVDAVEQGYREAGEVIVRNCPRAMANRPRACGFSQRFECKQCNIRYEEPEPRLFSFNNPFGACPRCQGFGNTIDFDLNLVIPNKTLTLAEGAIEPWTKPKYRPLATEMRRYARAAGVPLDVPWQDLTPDQQSFIIEGDGKFWGVRGFFDHLERKKYKLHVRVFLSRYRGYSALLRVWRPAPATRSAPGENRRQRYLRSIRDDRRGGDELLLAVGADAAGSRHRR